MTQMNGTQMNGRQTKRTGERGNVLFLILIAVALFAALSYAVTQSSRSGGGDANKETNLVNSASITQYPAGVRTSVIRMMVSNGVDVDSLSFDPPSAFTTALTTDVLKEANAFYPTGGGATHGLGPADIMADSTQHPWHFNADFEVENIGTSAAGDEAGNDVIAFLAHLNTSVCKKINEQLGITSANPSGLPEFAISAAEYDNDKLAADSPAIPATEEVLDGELSGQPFGCFIDTTPATDVNVYYHVLIER